VLQVQHALVELTAVGRHDDFFEIAVGPDGYLDGAYQHYVGPANGDSEIFFVRGTVAGTETGTQTRFG
jgi:hypothetical protein